MSDLPDFAAEQPLAPEPTPAAEIATPESASQSAATLVAEPAPQPAPEPAQTVVDPVTGQHVPLPTFLDMRDRATTAEKEAKQLREWRQQQEAALHRQPAPDPNQDPAGYQAHQSAQFQAALYEQRRDTSKAIAEMRHGEDVVKAAFEWGAARCDEDPFFNQKVRASSDPYAFVVNEWRRDQVASKVDPTDYDEYLAWKAAKSADPANPQPAAGAPTPPARPQAPRASIAAAPPAGASADPQPLGAERTFERMFGS